MQKFLLGLCLFATAMAGPNSSITWIGTLDSEGVLTPLARVEAHQWSNPWPAPFDETSPGEPKSLEEVPDAWYAEDADFFKQWRLANMDPLVIDRPARTSAHCAEKWALATQSQTSQEDNHGLPQLAFWGSVQQHEKAQRLAESKELRNVNQAVAPVFDALESQAVETELRESGSTRKRLRRGHPLSAAERRQNELKVTVYRVPTLGSERVLYRVRAVRDYKKPSDFRDASCEASGLLQGWLWMDEEQADFQDERFLLTDCDFVEVESMHPMATIEVSSRVFIISVQYGYEWESVPIFEVVNGRLNKVFQADAGGC